MTPKHLLLPAALVASHLLADPADIPQWRGPHRDGIFPDTGLLKEWPPEGPKLEWRKDKLGQGLSGVSIVGGTIFTTAGRGSGQFIVAIDLATRAEKWAAQLCRHGGEIRSTPTVDGGLVYAVSTEGDLVCVKAADGSEVWRKNYDADFNHAPKPTWTFSESPLVDGDQLVVVPGSDEAMMAALDKKTGALLWKTEAHLDGKGHGGAGYTGAVVSTAGGLRQYVTMVGKGAIGVEAKTGHLLWHYNRVANGTAVIPTPLVWDDYVFVSSGYGAGAALLKIVPAPKSATPAPAPAVDQAKVDEWKKKLAELNAAIAQRRDARAKTKSGTPEYDAANKLVQDLKPDIERAEHELKKARGQSDAEEASTVIPGSPVFAEEQYFLNASVFQNHHGGMVRLGDYIYAGKGHNNGFPVCLEWRTGRIVWEKPRGPGKESAAVIEADGNLYFRYQNALMALIEATPKGYVEKGTFKLATANGPSWPHPTIYDGKLFVRDQDTLMCYDLR